MRLVGLVALFLVGCGGPPPVRMVPRALPKSAPRTMADEGFRAAPPVTADTAAWSPPAIAERTLSNGIRLLVIERHEVPVVAVRIVSDRGADQADRGIPEVWAESILRAGVKHPWYEVRDDFDRMAIDWHAQVAHDSTTIELEVLAKLFKPAMQLVGDLMVKPVISEAELDRAQSRVLRKIESADLQVASTRALGHLFYAHEHPYNEAFAPSENVPRVNGDLVLAYHASAFTPAHVTIVVTGDVELEGATAALESAFAPLSGQKLGAVTPPKTPIALPPARFTIIDENVAAQAYLAAAWFSPTLGSEDELPLLFAKQILSARLYEDVRRDRGATYGLRVTIPVGRATQLARIEGYVQIASVADAVKDILADLDSLASEPPDPETMTWSRIGAISSITGSFEGPETTAAALSILGVRNEKTTFFADRLAAIRKVEAAQVLRAIRAWLSNDAVRFVIVGSANQIKPKLEALGIGAVVVRKAFLP